MSARGAKSAKSVNPKVRQNGENAAGGFFFNRPKSENIKNPRAEQLANQLARKTGETITDAVIHALEDRLERLEGCRTSTDLVEEIMGIAARCSKLPVLDSRSCDEILGYSDIGAFR